MSQISPTRVSLSAAIFTSPLKFDSFELMIDSLCILFVATANYHLDSRAHVVDGVFVRTRGLNVDARAPFLPFWWEPLRVRVHVTLNDLLRVIVWCALFTGFDWVRGRIQRLFFLTRPPKLKLKAIEMDWSPVDKPSIPFIGTKQTDYDLAFVWYANIYNQGLPELWESGVDFRLTLVL